MQKISTHGKIFPQEKLWTSQRCRIMVSCPLDSTNPLNYTQANYTKNDESETSSSSDSVSISEQARLLFAQSYGQYNGLTASMQSSDTEDSLAQSYTASGKADESAAGQLAAESAVATEQAQSAAPAPAEGGQGGGGGQGGSEGRRPALEQENIRQQISALQSRVSMLSATLASGDTTRLRPARQPGSPDFLPHSQPCAHNSLPPSCADCQRPKAEENARSLPLFLEQFPFETLRVPNHTACRFVEKTRFFRLVWAGRRCAAASRFHLAQR